MNNENIAISEKLLSEPTNRIAYKFKYVCKSKCKKFALEFAKINRPSNKFTRVSEDFLISCEVAVKNHIQSRIRSHPSIGKTLQ